MEYEAFIEKFKPKKTTDDCYTPYNIYDVVCDYVANNYNVCRDNFVRPFYPGGDYENFDYNDNKIVVDNPPFSILSKIKAFYNSNNIKYFLFAPTLTLFSTNDEKTTFIPVGVAVEYENGARVNTSFATNLEDSGVKIKTAPQLYKLLKIANDENVKSKHKQLPRYKFPNNVITSTKVSQCSRLGIDVEILKSECQFIRQLDSQKKSKKAIFGNGYLISDTVREAIEKVEREKVEREKVEREKVEREKANNWELSDREKQIIKNMKVEDK